MTSLALIGLEAGFAGALTARDLGSLIGLQVARSFGHLEGHCGISYSDSGNLLNGQL